MKINSGIKAQNSKLKVKSLNFLLLTFIFTIIFTILLFTFDFTFAADIGQAGLDIAVLNTGVGVRALGMGSAFTAVANNSDAPYWNPAGLSQIKRSEITTMQTQLSTDADNYYISVVMPFLSGGLGISWIRVSTGSILQTSGTTDAYNEVQNLSEFSYYSDAYLLAYGQNITDNLSIGVTAIYLSTNMPGLSDAGGFATGYSLTPGILYKPLKDLSIGFKIDQFMNRQQWETDTEEIAPSIDRLGIAYSMKLFSYEVLLCGDASQVNKAGYTAEFNYGTEISKDSISVRCGSSDNAFTAGLGMKFGQVGIDYAYVTQMNLSKNNVNRVSLTGKW